MPVPVGCWYWRPRYHDRYMRIPPPHGRILALDFGKKRIGLAISDPLRITAQGLDTLHRTRIREDLDALARLIEERGVTWILLGDPLHMSGQASKQQQVTHEFGDRLSRRTGVPVEYWDERLTSSEASRVLRSSGISVEKRAQAIDKLSAVLILDSYLERLRLLPASDEGEAQADA